MSVDLFQKATPGEADDEFPVARVSSNGTIIRSNAIFDQVVDTAPRLSRILAPAMIVNCLERIPNGKSSTTVSLPEIAAPGFGIINSLVVRRTSSGGGLIELQSAAAPLEVQFLRDIQMQLLKLDSTRKPIAMFKWALFEPEEPGGEPVVSVTSDFPLSPTVGKHVDFKGPTSDLEKVAYIVNRDDMVAFANEFLEGKSPQATIIHLIDQGGINRSHVVTGQRLGVAGVIASGVSLDITNWAKVGRDLEAEERLAISSVELSALQQDLSNTATMLQTEAYLHDPEGTEAGTSELGQLAGQTSTSANVLGQVVQANTKFSRQRYVPKSVDGAIDKQITWDIVQSARRKAADIPIKCDCKAAEGYRPAIEFDRMQALSAKLVQHAAGSVRAKWGKKAESSGRIHLELFGAQYEDRKGVSLIVSDNGLKADLFEGSEATSTEYDRHWNLIRTQMRALRGDLTYWYDKQRGNCYRLCIPCSG